MDEQEVKLDYPNSPPPPGQEVKEPGEKFAQWWDKNKPSASEKETGEASGEPECIRSKSPPEPGLDYDKTLDDTLKTGDFKIVMGRERTHDYDPAGATDEMNYREAGNFLREKLEASLDMGGTDAFRKTLDHFENEFEKGDLISGDMLGEAKALFAEARELRSKEEFKEFWTKAEKFYQSWEIGKKED